MIKNDLLNSAERAELIDKIWQDPSRCTGSACEWVMTPQGKYISNHRPDGSTDKRRDKMVLERKDGTIYFNYHGSRYDSLNGDVFNLAAYQMGYNTTDADFWCALRDMYGVESRHRTQDEINAYEERRKNAERKREERPIIDMVARYITEALNTEEGKVARDYLNGRHLQPSARLGAYNTRIRTELSKLIVKDHGKTKDEADAMLKRFFPASPDDYQLAAPYTNGKDIIGFWMRATTPDILKYKYSSGMSQLGYCSDLLQCKGYPVYLVEGMLDAEAMKQHGCNNVLAIGTSTPLDGTIATLERFHVDNVIYCADYEVKDGKRWTEYTRKSVMKLSAHMRDVGVDGFQNVSVIEFEDGTDAKDVADFLPKYGFDKLPAALKYHEWLILDAYRTHHDDQECLIHEIVSAYVNTNNDIEKRIFLQTLTNNAAFADIRKMGVTADLLKSYDTHGKSAEYRKRMEEECGHLADALEKHKTSATIGRIVNDIVRVQHYDEVKNFTDQVHVTDEQMMTQVGMIEPCMNTGWPLFRKGNDGNIHEAGSVTFTPGSISVVAAPTSHGKTLFMLQTAINISARQHRHNLYVSFENNEAQLFMRAVSAYAGSHIDKDLVVPMNDKNLCNNGAELWHGKPRQAIRMYCAGEEFNDGCMKREFVEGWIKHYQSAVRPYLALTYGSKNIITLCDSIRATINEWRYSAKVIGAVFIDYLQLLRYEGRNYSRTDEVKAICDELNALSKELNVPIVCAVQFNRDATKAGGATFNGVTLSNIGESAGIENYAEDVYMVWDTFRIPEDERNKESKQRVDRCRDDNGFLDGYLYIETLKARESAIGGYVLLPKSGQYGCILDNVPTHPKK